jgi:nitroreductase
MESIELFEAMRTQTSARGYTDEEVSDEDVERILEAATWAPNATNSQLWEFIVVRDPEVKRKLAALYRKSYKALADSMPENKAVVDDPEAGETLTPGAKAAYVGGVDPRTAPRTMLKWSVNLAETLQDVPVIVVVGWDRGAMPYAKDGVFKAFTDETVYTGVVPAIQNLMLAARGLGLGTCLTTVANVYEGKVKDVLGVPEHVQLVALLPLGRPSTPFVARKRIPVAEKVHRDRW